MSEAEEGEGSPNASRSAQSSTATFVLRPLVQDIPLSGEEHSEQARITCVELCDDNLYVGTSQAEILHFVSIPADPGDELSAPTYIFASRLQPGYVAQASTSVLPGVQQILVLPKVQKACILCNGTLSFYSLPELSPAFPNTTVPNCTWVGGVNLGGENGADENGVVVMICAKTKVRLVRIRDEARRVKDIEYPGCLVSARRGNFACVADARSYALLDLENQQKISLFPISSLDDNAAGGRIEDISTAQTSPARRSSTSRPISSEGNDSKGHGRSTSLGAFVGGLGKRQASPHSSSRDRSGLSTPEPIGRDPSPSQLGHARMDSTPAIKTPMPNTPDKPLPPPPHSDSLRPPKSTRSASSLTPHICSPTPGEFLLTTGTAEREPGVGIFVNLDGDVVRGTLEFSQYPRAVVVTGNMAENESAQDARLEKREGFVLATMKQSRERGEQTVVEIQRWDVENGGVKEWVDVPDDAGREAGQVKSRNHSPDDCGLRTISKLTKVPFPEIGELLRGRRLESLRNESPSPSFGHALEEAAPEDGDENRNKEETEFGRRLGGQTSTIALWSGSSIWWVVRNPLAAKLDAAINVTLEAVSAEQPVNRGEIIRVVNSIRGQEASTETEFLSLEYIRQKASLVLFADLLIRSHPQSDILAADLRISEGSLMEGCLDPRVILSLIPVLRDEVIEGVKGIWIHAGLVPVVDRYRPMITKSWDEFSRTDILGLIKRYLGAWRQRKGFGSIADEVEVFQTVDAALLRVLLYQDETNSSQSSKPSPERIELYSLVDSGVDCFERAIRILEQHRRLFVLSRLYQSRRMARKVLETWKRIIEGERDDGGGLSDGENEVRKYLINIKDTALVDEYGTWLAARNPALGVQIFTNDNSRVKWEPHQVVMLLRRKAPDAVKDYLEHLVFGKKNVRYANDLISYYLDSVLTILGSSDEARAILAQSYESYRALHPPKPTYRQFIIENAVQRPWWHDRLRLLELIGGSHGSDFSYDVPRILSRIEPFEQDLVPESIILDGRQGRHKQALRLLTHGLGDYHTAVNYCLLGGASIFHPTSASAAPLAAPTQEEQARLFNYLLAEFLVIEDPSDRLERTSELLERFSAWYDVRDVLHLIPESWSVELVSGFLISALRRLVQEKNEATITKALSGAENLQIAAAFVEKCAVVGPRVETVRADSP